MRKVYNLTNVPTAQLESAGLVNVPIRLGDVVIKPGCCEPVPQGMGAQANRYIKMGALHVGERPPEGFKPAAQPAPAPAPPAPTRPAAPARRTLAVQSTVNMTDSVSTKESSGGKSED